MVTWEYKALNVKKIPGMALEDTLNKHGREGWEVVAEMHGYIVLKRPAS